VKASIFFVEGKFFVEEEKRMILALMSN